MTTHATLVTWLIGGSGSYGRAGAFTFRGQVATVANLPATGNTAGDALLVTAGGHMHVWDGSKWADAGALAAGVQGAPGVRGNPGPAGPPGPAGAAGGPGTIGPVGPTGPAGPRGQSGSNGAAGIQGPIGRDGPIGPAGPVGAGGPKGDKGDPGQTLVIDHVVASAADLPTVPGRMPSVYLVAGDRNVWVFDPASPMASVGVAGVADGWVNVGKIGNDGPKGAAGPPGPPGPQGPTGVGLNMLQPVPDAAARDLAHPKPSLGDTLVVLDTGTMETWDGVSWVRSKIQGPIGPPGPAAMGWRGSVADPSHVLLLPSPQTGDWTIALSDGTMWVFTAAGQWVGVKSGQPAGAMVCFVGGAPYVPGDLFDQSKLYGMSIGTLPDPLIRPPRPGDMYMDGAGGVTHFVIDTPLQVDPAKFHGTVVLELLNRLKAALDPLSRTEGPRAAQKTSQLSTTATGNRITITQTGAAPVLPTAHVYFPGADVVNDDAGHVPAVGTTTSFHMGDGVTITYTVAPGVTTLAAYAAALNNIGHPLGWDVSIVNDWIDVLAFTGTRPKEGLDRLGYGVQFSRTSGFTSDTGDSRGASLYQSGHSSMLEGGATALQSVTQVLANDSTVVLEVPAGITQGATISVTVAGQTISFIANTKAVFTTWTEHRGETPYGIPRTGDAMMFDRVSGLWTASPAYLQEWRSRRYLAGEVVTRSRSLWRATRNIDATVTVAPGLSTGEAFLLVPTHPGRILAPDQVIVAPGAATAYAPTAPPSPADEPAYLLNYSSDTEWVAWSWDPGGAVWSLLVPAATTRKVWRGTTAPPTDPLATEILLWIVSPAASTTTAPVAAQQYWEPIPLG